MARHRARSARSTRRSAVAVGVVVIVGALLGATAFAATHWSSLWRNATGAGAGAAASSPARSMSPTAPTAGATPAASESAASTPSPSATDSPAESPAPAAGPSAEEVASFDALSRRLGSQVGLAYLDGSGQVRSLGPVTSGPAWSSIKVPLALAALGRPNGSTMSLATSAITVSDNDAAWGLWNGLGGGGAAAAEVDGALRAHDDSTTWTQSQQVRPPYTPFGQTEWALADQTRVARAVACRAGGGGPDGTVWNLMGQVTGGQRWGLGRVAGAAFKGGWGPSASGGYFVRQFGVVTVNDQRYAVALASWPGSGSFGGGTADLDALADWFATSRPVGATGFTCS